MLRVGVSPRDVQGSGGRTTPSFDVRKRAVNVGGIRQRGRANSFAERVTLCQRTHQIDPMSYRAASYRAARFFVLACPSFTARSRASISLSSTWRWSTISTRAVSSEKCFAQSGPKNCALSPSEPSPVTPICKGFHRPAVAPYWGILEPVAVASWPRPGARKIMTCRPLWSCVRTFRFPPYADVIKDEA